MKRRMLAALALSCACLPALAQTPPKTLKMVAHADLKILDPTFTTAYISRNFGHMVYESLFAQDAGGKPQPQMVEKYAASEDGKLWRFTLRPGLKFSDGSAVTSADAIASLQRWAARDSMGRAMLASGAAWKASDARSFTLTLDEPFGLVLDALAKPSGFPPLILPERLAKMPASAPLTEVLGSGPYVFKRDEWVPGNKVVFVRNPHYVPRSEPPNGLAGGKRSPFERVEWLYLPDANSAIAALKRGEVDLIEQLPPDYIAALRSDKSVKIGSGGAYQGLLVFNHLHPPFNNPKVRQALLQAVSQERFTTAMGYPLDMRVTHCPSYFICGGSNETAAGAEPYRRADLARARQMLAASGYKGEKVALLVPSDITYLNAEALMAAQTMRSIGMNVDMQTMDWSSISARRTRRDAPEAGGWNVYATAACQLDIDSPITNLYLGAACGNTLPGWPCDKPLDELRSVWLKERAPAKRKELLDAFQRRAYETVPYVSTGQYSIAFAARTSLKGAEGIWAGIPMPWMFDK
ncbi:ABC transporter substrate-binding protein [Verminephrobacter aporrectodeae]|uniref:ABC transporter substrate-binding protein n=1 Tax=Verminephrobacter aporrectodeae subsp. tuberculatae TaxID=1110392 RepID=A0ABT3KSA6_9BURK|nr:ABC transporter substrate-binding protein [Verminephrobacter aporrectodeae]MCW5321145.1 ABC transporter substrate-binding protein [Verminephrobacter aporrectodeae subsp. tuberculatae]MCW8176052.1 ABC transporter substrate-binding protein [Verminephrobacter aporrectodeae subsp. tuberculatae]MCW8199114.1 ABC transporter substrate-binding protein [Verminephrobacter aporrectodeae subsp. tuberculatae]MCW8203669.1 ABC transporter substrate-binding protein [Verminephrobacter aporrectodeae subsp. tu